MRKLTVLVDMDDTIENLSFTWCKYLNARHGTDVPYEAVNQWDMSQAFPMLTKEQVYSPLSGDNIWDWVEPIDGAVDALRKLKEDGHDVLILTASNYHSIKAKMEKVLFRYFPFLTWDDVIITSRKQLIAGDVLVDDGLHNFYGGSYKKILMSAMHNTGLDESKVGAVRVNNWIEAYDLIRQYASSEEKFGRRYIYGCNTVFDGMSKMQSSEAEAGRGGNQV